MFKLIPKHLRKFPHVKPHNWLNHELIVRFLEEMGRKYATGTLVDIGCGKKPYKEVFAPFVEQHIGVDLVDAIHGNEEVDIVGSAYETGLEAGSCDVILCSEVLEHLEEPEIALKELNRILTKGGRGIFTVPFFWPVHEAPRDFYRYTEYGLRHLFEKAAFDEIDVVPLTGFWPMAIQMLIYATRRLKGLFLLRHLVGLGHYWLQKLAMFTNRYDKRFQFTNLYGVVATKYRSCDEPAKEGLVS